MDSFARQPHFLVTCEHGGNRVPLPYRELFASHEALLLSHRGHDQGAATLARQLARELGCAAIIATTTRLLIDLNRSSRHPGLFSEITRPLPAPIREQIVARYYRPYRERVNRNITGALAEERYVVHISSHSFTPTIADVTRNADVGFLYDPARVDERRLCLRWIAALRRRSPAIRLRQNYPYTGASDGFCTWLRQRHSADDYLGIELEVNQQHALAGGPAWRLLRADIASALLDALASPRPRLINLRLVCLEPVCAYGSHGVHRNARAATASGYLAHR